MYGASGRTTLLDEDAPLHPLTAYAESKVRAEEALAGAGRRRLLAVFMRNATVYGVSPRLRLDIVLNNLVGWAFTTGRIRILSDGTPWRPWSTSRTSPSALALLEAPREPVHGEAFNVGADDQNYQVRDLARDPRSGHGLRDRVRDRRVPDPRSYRVDFSKLAGRFPSSRSTGTRGAAPRSWWTPTVPCR